MSRGFSRFGIAALILALIELLLFGVIGVGRKKEGAFFDTTYFYAAGRAWLARQNAYSPPVLISHAEGRLDGQIGRFYYPPQSAPLTILIGLAGYRVGTFVLRGLNIAALLALSLLVLRAIRPSASLIRDWRELPWLAPALILGSTWAVNISWGGAVVPITTAFLMAGWMAVERDRPVLGGVLMGLATIKPQFALLPMIWLTLERRWKVVGVAAATTVVLMAWPLAAVGPRTVFEGWFTNIRLHDGEWCNALGWPYLIGVRNLVYSLGVTIPHLTIPTVALTVGLWFARKRFPREDVLGLLTVMSLTLLVAHDYDLLLLVPLLAAFWRHLSDRPRDAAIALALAAVIVFPTTLVVRVPFWPVVQRCTLVPLILMGWLAWLSFRGDEQVAERAPVPISST